MHIGEEHYAAMLKDAEIQRAEIATLRADLSAARAEVEMVRDIMAKHGKDGEFWHAEWAIATERAKKAESESAKFQAMSEADIAERRAAESALAEVRAENVRLREALGSTAHIEAGESCWCFLPSMIPYRGHDAGCEAARAALAAAPQEKERKP